MSDAQDARAETLKHVFGVNLRHLANQHPSVSGLCRDLGINRTQFNRYLSGESYPRPEVLERICAFFDTDARILLEPLEQIRRKPAALLDHPEISGFLTTAKLKVAPDAFPEGFYRSLTPSLTHHGKVLVILSRVYRRDEQTFIRGYQPRALMRHLGLPETGAAREFRGSVFRQSRGVGILMARREANSSTYCFVHSATPDVTQNLWMGCVVRQNQPGSGSGMMTFPILYDYLGRDLGRALRCARRTGFADPESLPRFHRMVLSGTMAPA
ncbi:helix-turn-helix transcriptional regulator [Pseudooceanicola sp. CBS1P-1]|uniref:Helix-turn-helix domain-containing protein n=1 Tax=Pseudooceanicola albus TaxID=2692189 RepID=A0A6L7G0A7_9RHOB|nr:MULTISPECIES: helix-turn-helix transcriptional regulator [Pseudooceanicola]MBT9382409.1 helix-turn-helix transcriptional regulator [Pseudooceanicola endophyticus]MXN16950.1 helix-turn-helix domain-containing protein [Pseudooceanicola albus]